MMSKKVNILYVDDESINLMLFKTMFRKKYRILTAASPGKGMEVLGQNPDTEVVISDMRMPEMDGLEFIREAKRKFPGVMFYILTGFEITHEIEDAVEKGLIRCYFQKPFKMDKIDRVISEELKDGTRGNSSDA